MTAKTLKAEFEVNGVTAGRVVVYDERTALSLINSAEHEYVAVVSIEPIRAQDLSTYSVPEGHALTDLERLRSWNSAREFVETLSGRGLYFDVVLESRIATFLAKLRYLFRNGAEWSPGRGGGTIQ